MRPCSGQARPQTSLDAHAPETATLDSDLGDALRDLSEAAGEAAASEFPVPSSAAIDNAKRLLVAMYDAAPRRFEVYPTPDGEVAIDAPTGRGSSVLLLCDSGGGVMCLVNTVGAQRLMRYGSAGEVPAAVLRDALSASELFAAIRARGVAREAPLVVATLAEFAAGRLRVAASRVLDASGAPAEPADLTAGVDAQLGRA